MRLAGQAPPYDPELHAPERPWVLLVDDGELELVRRIAEELGATTLRKTVASRGKGWRQPQRLLAVSDRRALTLGRPVAQEEERFTTLAILHEGTATLRRYVAGMGFDHVLERDPDPRVVRRLVRAALYRGPEQRRERRLPVALPVTLRSGWHTSRAELADLTRQACALRLRRGGGALGPVVVELPRGIAPGGPVEVRGRAFRERLQDRGGSVLLSVAFRHTSLSQVVVDAALALLRSGPPPRQR